MGLFDKRRAEPPMEPPTEPPKEPENAIPQKVEKIGPNEVRKATEILRKYKDGKRNLEQRIIDNEEWWKLRHWNQIREGAPQDIEPASAWLVNCILAKHADAMDSMPAPTILPREAGDQAEAKKLSSIMPVILEQNEFPKVYSDVWWYKLKTGTGVYGVSWDANKLNGLGDITIKKLDLLNLFWEPAVTDIQDSRNMFYVELVDNEVLIATYPDLEGKLDKTAQGLKAEYIYDDSVDTTDKSLVIEWYYKKREAGKSILHYVKYVGDNVLYATENVTEPPTRDVIQNIPVNGMIIPTPTKVATAPPMSVAGLYEHGQYPFVFDVMFPEEGTPVGFGYIDLCKNPQKQIDLLNNAIVQNALVASTPRWFVRADGNVNEAEYADITNKFIHVSGNLGDDSIRRIDEQQLAGVYVQYLDEKILEMKETAGNRDVSNGASTSGVTAASAVAALQEAGGKLSRDNITASYRAYSQVVRLCLELIRQFYDLPRQFRILGEFGEQEFVSYSNAGIQPQRQEAFGVDMGYRSPVFDIEVDTQKESKYSEMAYNELAIQMYQLGFFNPQLTDQALVAINMMQFKGKDDLMQKLKQNGTLYEENLQLKQQVLQLATMVDAMRGTNMADQFAQGILQQGGGAPAPSPEGGGVEAYEKGMAKAMGTNEPTNVARARAASQATTEPR